MNESQVFTNALKHTSPAERAAYLDATCAGDPQLRAAVEELLRAQDSDPGFLEQPAASLIAPATDRPAAVRPTATVGPATDRAGVVLAGRYKLLEEIGEGGMGTVWMAQQTEPVKRLVAVKLIKPGMDSKLVLARFEAERQALALMDHPNIAKVHDAGVAPDGRPFFVMELVKGVAITRYCDDHKLTTRQRLELFVPVCQAVQHAHQKGVIHRDLKPSNVLVARYDDRPVPKVIDFGVAKATGQQLTEQTAHTGFGAVVGTVEYMSPEQATFNQLDVDTRSDVYSLGVLLYELLTGSPPFSKKELEKAGMLETLRVIREEEPTKPSTKLRTAEGLPTLAANRGTAPARLTKLVRGELDWIVMTALEKDRNRRYETANSFALDVQRYLADEPVLACPPSVGYRLRKLARRNKVGLAVAALVLFFLVLLGSGAGWAVRDRSAREVEAARQQGERQAKVAGQVESILAEADRLEKEQKWPEALAAARRAAAVVTGGEADQATADRVGDRLRGLEFVSRLEQIRMDRATVGLEEADREYARAFRDFGVDVEEWPAEASIERLQARAGLAIPFAAALDDWASMRDRTGGAWKRMVAVARGIDPEPLRDRLRATGGQPITAEVRDELRRLADSIDVRAHPPATIYSLAIVLKEAKQVDAAIRILREARAVHPGDFWINYELAAALYDQKDREGSIRFNTAAVSIRPCSAGAHNNLGVALRDQKKLDEAAACFRMAVDLGPERLGSRLNLGYALGLQGKSDEAKAEYAVALRLHPGNPYAHHAFGCFLRDILRDYEGAAAALRKAIELDSEYARSTIVYADLCRALSQQGKLEEAVAALEGVRRSREDQRHALPVCLNDLAWDLATHAEPALRDPVRAVSLAREAVELNSQEGMCRNTLGTALYRAGDWEAAIETLQRADQLSGGRHFGYNAFFIAMSYWQLGNRDAARRWYDRAVEWMDKNQPKNEELRRFRAEATELLGTEKMKD